MAAKAERDLPDGPPRAGGTLAGLGSPFWAASPLPPAAAANALEPRERHRPAAPTPTPSQEEEVIVPLARPRDQLGPVTELRSTLLTTSLKAIRDRGYGERYLAHLPRHYHEPVRTCIAGVWLPIELAVAHYDACDAIGIPTSEQMQIGREVGMKIQGTFLGTVVKLAKAAGVTPWLAIGQYQRLWDRVFVGGGVTVTKLGPKEARLELIDLELARIPYFRTAFRGVNEASCELFCSRVYVEEIKKLCTAESLGFRIMWA